MYVSSAYGNNAEIKPTLASTLIERFRYDVCRYLTGDCMQQIADLSKGFSLHAFPEGFEQLSQSESGNGPPKRSELEDYRAAILLFLDVFKNLQPETQRSINQQVEWTKKYPKVTTGKPTGKRPLMLFRLKNKYLSYTELGLKARNAILRYFFREAEPAPSK